MSYIENKCREILVRANQRICELEKEIEDLREEIKRLKNIRNCHTCKNNKGKDDYGNVDCGLNGLIMDEYTYECIEDENGSCSDCGWEAK